MPIDGAPVRITTAPSMARIHLYPSFVEGTSAVLFTIAENSNLSAAQTQGAEIAVVDVSTDSNGR